MLHRCNVVGSCRFHFFTINVNKTLRTTSSVLFLEILCHMLISYFKVKRGSPRAEVFIALAVVFIALAKRKHMEANNHIFKSI